MTTAEEELSLIYMAEFRKGMQNNYLYPWVAAQTGFLAGRASMREEAAKEAESWMELFNFNSFASDDVRRCANPNQIAARIRGLAKEFSSE